MATPTTVDAYVDAAPSVAQAALRELRHLILTEVPTATERIRYGMPSYDYGGQRFIHFAAAKAHLGVYGLVHEDRVVPEELAPFLDHRSTLRLPYDRPLPSTALAAAIRDKATGVDLGKRPRWTDESPSGRSSHDEDHDLNERTAAIAPDGG